MDRYEIEARLRRILESLARLRQKQALTFEQLTSDRDKLLAAERDLQVAIEAAIDVGSDLLAKHWPKVAGGYRQILAQMGEAGILPRDSADRIAPMGGFRNILVHMYLEVDPRKVYDVIQHGLDDLEEFVCHVSRFVSEHGDE